MKKLTCLLFICFSSAVVAQDQKSTANIYTFEKGDPNGTGKRYMGRQIAHVMGFEGMNWLNRPEREAEENSAKLLNNMGIKPGDTIADIGAGSGYHVFKMASIDAEVFVYAVDIQDEMLAVMDYRIDNFDIDNVAVVKGGEQEVNLPENGIDKILMVDVYHEFSYPKEMMKAIKKALRPGGQVYLIEYRAEDINVPIKEVHKMSEKQAILELEAAGFKFKKNIKNLPWQHCLVFVNE
jgi:precorrin-6B methylase 2